VPVSGIEGLTGRQLECLDAFCRHDCGEEAAYELFIGVQTLKNNLTAAYKKLGVPTGRQACYLLGRDRRDEGERE
jgi:DNA-binding CsgD family transcriptional regulator